MTSERKGLIQIGGKDATVVGDDLKVGDRAPEFTAQANDWSEAPVIASTRGKVRVILAMPSLSTDVCDKETKTFNQRVTELGPDVQVVAVTTDLPPTQKNWCAAAGVDRVMAVSDHMATEFGVKYGTLIKERRWLRRAVFVVGRDDRLKYVAYLPRLGDEPNYDEVLAAAKGAV